MNLLETELFAQFRVQKERNDRQQNRQQQTVDYPPRTSENDFNFYLAQKSRWK
jgi:hypothetical protein